jgi:hypothetical protein
VPIPVVEPFGGFAASAPATSTAEIAAAATRMNERRT